MKVLFRAKEKNLDNYVTGYEYYNHIEDEYYITHYITGNNYKIDRNTRSINFEDMIDSQGNKIFASLQEDGKGGDIIDNFNFQEKYRNQIAVYKYNCFHLMDKDGDTYSLIECKLQEGIKVIGIQE